MLNSFDVSDSTSSLALGFDYTDDDYGLDSTSDMDFEDSDDDMILDDFDDDMYGNEESLESMADDEYDPIEPFDDIEEEDGYDLSSR